MMAFVVRALDASLGTIREEHSLASNAEDARRQVADLGLVVLSVSPDHRGQVAKRPLVDSGLSWWCRELRTLLIAGMTVVEALDTMRAQASGGVRSDVNASLVSCLQQGLSLSTAMQQVGGFPPILTAGVKGSERTGSLVPAIDDYLKYHDLLERLQKQLVSAAIYPAIVIGLGLTITGFLLLFVMPRFAHMYGELRGATSWVTGLMLSLSAALGAHTTLIALGLAVALIAAFVSWRGGWIGRLGDAMVTHIPALARRADEFRFAKLYQALAVMFRGGFPLDDALGHCRALGLGAHMADRVERARLALSRGQRVSTAWAEAGLADVVSARLLAVGERTGNFDLVLMTIADRHASNFTTLVERATRIVEPILLLLVALVVGGIVVAMYMPVFDIASSIR